MTTEQRPGGDVERDETPAERLDRNYNELLQELRVAQTGVQILFAFLLSLPFLQGFNISETDRKVVYSVTLLSAAVATTLLIAPVPYHRLVFRQRRKQQVVRNANRLALVGLAFLLVAVTGALFLVFDELWSNVTAVVVAGGFAAGSVVLWFLLPVRALHRSSESYAEPPT